MKSSEFVSKLKEIATKYNTLYVMGSIGAPMNDYTANRYKSWYSYNRKPERSAMIDAAVKEGNVFGFDCVCLVKAVAWGWCADTTKEYGGCKVDYSIVGDYDANQMLRQCTEVSTDFTKIAVGEYLHMDGHCGVYIGDGLAVECTPKWENKVQITAVGNIGTKDKFNTRTWTDHGKLPFVDYNEEKPSDNGVSKVKVELNTMSKTSTGEQVKTIQRILKELGYKGRDGKVLAIDGVFGANSDYAVKLFQKREGLDIDGIVGANTWAALLK